MINMKKKKGELWEDERKNFLRSKIKNLSSFFEFSKLITPQKMEFSANIPLEIMEHILSYFNFKDIRKIISVSKYFLQIYQKYSVYEIKQIPNLKKFRDVSQTYFLFLTKKIIRRNGRPFNMFHIQYIQFRLYLF
jgi:hypothetical protein